MSTHEHIGPWSVLTNVAGTQNPLSYVRGNGRIRSSWTRGNVKLSDRSDAGIDIVTMTEAAHQLFDMASRFPTFRGHAPHVSIMPNTDEVFSVPPEKRIGMDPSAFIAGSTLTGTATIKLNEREFRLPEFNKNPIAMPVAQNVRYEWTYALAHEFGHAISPWDQERKVMRLGQSVIQFVSMYGRTGQWECFAECFAEFYMSKGQTTNIAARVFATEFGWADRMIPTVDQEGRLALAR